MKKILFAILALGLISCNGMENQGTLVNIHATCSNASFSQSDAISVYQGTAAAKLNAKAVESATKASFEGRLFTSSGTLSAVYPAAPTDGESPCEFSIATQKIGVNCSKAYASQASPSFDAPIEMEFKPMTGKGIISITNKSDLQFTLSSISADGGKLFYSKCDFAANPGKCSYSEPVITIETADKAIAVAETIEIPFYLFPGEVAQSKAALTLSLKDATGKPYQVFCRADFVRPKAGAESQMSMEITSDILDDGPKDYSIVYPKSLSGAELTAIQAIPAVIKAKTGLDIPCVSDDTAESEYEILYGETNRKSGASISCPLNAYIIKYTDKKLIIKGSSSNQRIAALYGLERNILSDSRFVTEGRLKFNSDIDICNETKETMAMRHMIKNLYDFTIKETLLKSFKGDSPVTVAQGACTDGEYGYYGFRNGAESRCIIYKHRLSDHVKVAQLELDLTDCNGYCHINDMVYEPDSDIIYVSAWSNTNGSLKVMLRVKASTMTQMSSISELTHSPTAIAYNKAEHVFMSRSGTKVYISDVGFTSSRLVNSAYEKYGYTNQGGGGDDLYCYFPVNNGTNSQLLTFDWAGHQLWNIQIDNKIESESIFVVDDKYYWWCYGSSAGHLYSLIPVMKYTPNFKGGWSSIESPGAQK